MSLKRKRNPKSSNEDNMKLAEWMATHQFRDVKGGESKRNYLQRMFAACGLEGWTGNSQSSKETFLKKKFADAKAWAQQTGEGVRVSEGEQSFKDKLLEMCPWFFIFLDEFDQLQQYNPTYLNDSGNATTKGARCCTPCDVEVPADLIGADLGDTQLSETEIDDEVQLLQPNANHGTDNVAESSKGKTTNLSFAMSLRKNLGTRQNAMQQTLLQLHALRATERNTERSNTQQVEMSKIALEREKFEWEKQMWQRQQQQDKELAQLRIEELKLKVKVLQLSKGMQDDEQQ